MFLLLWACSSEHTLNFFAPGQSYAHKVVRLQVVVVHGSVYSKYVFTIMALNKQQEMSSDHDALLQQR